MSDDSNVVPIDPDVLASARRRVRVGRFSHEATTAIKAAIRLLEADRQRTWEAAAVYDAAICGDVLADDEDGENARVEIQEYDRVLVVLRDLVSSDLTFGGLLRLYTGSDADAEQSA